MEWINKLITPITSVILSAIWTIIWTILWTKYKFYKYDTVNRTPSVTIVRYNTSHSLIGRFEDSPCYESDIYTKSDDDNNDHHYLKFNKISDITNYNFKSEYIVLIKIKNFSESTALLQYFVDKKLGNLSAEHFDFSLLEKDDDVVLVFSPKEKPSKIIMNFQGSKLTYVFDGINNGSIKPIVTSQKSKNN